MLDPLVAILLHYGLMALALLRTSSYWQRVTIWMIILPIDIHIFDCIKLITSPAYEGPKYILGCAALSNLIITSNLLVFIRDPRATIRKLDADGKPEPFPGDLKGQLDWFNGVLSSPRYVGFTYSVPHLKPAFSLNPFLFILYKLFHITLVTLITAAAWTVAIRLGYADALRPVQLFPSDTAWENWWRSVGSTILSIWTGYWSIGSVYGLISILHVALGSSPRGWPDAFGHVKDATTVAKAWGRVWHQTIRRLGTPLADFVTDDILGLRRRSVPWTIIQTILVFFISDLIHCGGDLAVSGGKQWWSPIFFMLQPLAFFFEAAVIELSRRVGITSNRFPWISRLVGYVWVVTWFSATFPMFAAGFWRENYYQNIVKFVHELV